MYTIKSRANEPFFSKNERKCAATTMNVYFVYCLIAVMCVCLDVIFVPVLLFLFFVCFVPFSFLAFKLFLSSFFFVCKNVQSNKHVHTRGIINFCQFKIKINLNKNCMQIIYSFPWLCLQSRLLKMLFKEGENIIENG